MAGSTVNIIKSVTENSSNVKASAFERTIYNNSGANISAATVIVNDGWDATYDCMKIRLPNSKNDIVFAMTTEEIESGSVKVTRLVVNGSVKGLNTSSFNVNDLLYPKTDGTLTNDPEDDPDDTIPQEIAIVVRSHVTEGEIYISSVGSQVQYVKLAALALIEAADAAAGSNDDGASVTLLAGDGDGTGDGGDVILEPGKASASGDDGKVILKQPGTLLTDNKTRTLEHDGTDVTEEVKPGSKIVKALKSIFRDESDATNANDLEIWMDSDGHWHIKSKTGYVKIDDTAFQIMASPYSVGKHIDIGHNGTNGFIVVPVGELDLSSYNTTINLGTGNLKGATAILSGLTASQIVETDASKNLISAAKGTAYNKAFGTGSGDVCEGDDSRLSDQRTPSDGSVTTAKMDNGLLTDSFDELELRWNGSTLEERTRTFTVTNGVIASVGSWSSWAAIGSV